MFFERLAALLLVIFVFPFSGQAGAGPEKTFVQNQLCQSELLGAEDEGLVPENDDESRLTVLPIKTIPGRHGGELSVLKRGKGMPWSSNYATFENAIQGDPRWFIQIAGKETARFFGFEMLPDGTMTIPGAVELTNAIVKVNRELARLAEPAIPMTFVRPEHNELNSFEFASFFFKGQIPLAFGDNVEVHDSSYHTSVVFIPPRYFRHALLQGSAFLKFIEHVESEIPELENNVDYLQLKKEAFESFAGQFDFGTGNFSRAFAGILKPSASQAQWLNLLYTRSLLRLTGGADPAFARVDKVFSDFRIRSFGWASKFKKAKSEFLFSKKPWVRHFELSGGEQLHEELLDRLTLIQNAVKRIEKQPF